MAKSGEPRILQIAIPIYNGITALDAIGPYNVLQLLPNVNIVFVSHSKGLYRDGVLAIEASASFDEVPSPDIIVVPGGFGTRHVIHDKPIIEWIRKVHETSLYTTSVCTGSLLLGAAGLLKGLEATTHWSAYEILSSFGAHPISSRIVHQGKIITTAGASAGIDMALQLVALITDETTAQAVQLLIEYDPQPPYDTGSIAKAGPVIVAKARLLAQSQNGQVSGE